MLREKRSDLVRALERHLGARLGDDVLNSLDEMIEIGDRSVAVLGQDVELAVVQMKRNELRQVDEALRRLRGGEYGSCRSCEAEIEEERLEILPFATLCVDCKRREEVETRRVETTGRGFRAGFRDVREAASEGDDEED
ncbi:MAG: TraR/DksA family transcriptional regulator [Candidatus Binatia bacterium]